MLERNDAAKMPDSGERNINRPQWADVCKKAGLLLFYAVIAYVIYLYGDDILAWLRRSDNAVLAIVIATVMALFPVVPYPLVGGVIGAAFGPAVGGAIVWTGSLSASLLMFLFFRYGYRDWGERALNKYERFGKLTASFERNAFIAILFARMIPFVPSIVVNVYAALSRVSFGVFAPATALGKIPAILLFVIVGDSARSNPAGIGISIGIYAIFLVCAIGLQRLWQKRQAGIKYQ